MKRVKRLFACLLALTMMLGLSATAFATETAEKVQTPANGGTVTFEKEYKLVGEGISPAETFEFNIAKAGVENGGVDAEKQDMPTVGTAAYAQNGATTAGNKKEVTVALPTYTSVGVYSYIITEKTGTTAGVAYDSKSVTMKVLLLTIMVLLRLQQLALQKLERNLLIMKLHSTILIQLINLVLVKQ